MGIDMSEEGERRKQVKWTTSRRRYPEVVNITGRLI